MKRHFTGMAMLCLFLTIITNPLSGCRKDDHGKETDKRPTADFDFSITSAGNVMSLPADVKFTSRSQHALSYIWDFGDGTSGTEPNPAHTYTEAGTYSVKLVVQNRSGKDSITRSVLISGDDPSPLTWQEDWGYHQEMLHRVYYSRNVVVYFDKHVNPELKWPFAMLDTVWGYVKAKYGDFGRQFGKDDRLYAIFHTNNELLNGGHPAAYFDDHHHFRNVLDCGSGGGLNAWKDDWGWNTSVLVHEIGHIVEGASYGTKESPAFEVWGDSKWAEIFCYDVFRNIGRARDAQDTYNECMDKADNFPIVGSRWFKDWYLPIYTQYGEVEVLNRFFQLLSQNFPKYPFLYLMQYARRMDFGEYLHFMSAAAGANLQPLATKAFGWKQEWTGQFNAAKSRYPNLTYTGIGDPLVNTEEDVELNGSVVSIAASAENQYGPEGTNGSVRLNDNNINSGYYSTGFVPGSTLTLTLNSPQIVRSYTLGVEGHYSNYDARSWVFEGSNDNATWTTLDSQTDRKFFDQARQYRFRFPNTTAYRYYRLKVNALNGGSELHLNELKLWKLNPTN